MPVRLPLFFKFCLCAICAAASCAGSSRGWVYLWKQSHDPQTARALGRAQNDFEGVNFLYAKISFATGTNTPVLQKLPVDASTLGNLKTPLVLSVRISMLKAEAARYREMGADIADMIADCLRSTLADGIGVAEVQIDFDCPESKIGEYARWMGLFRARLPKETRLCFTAVPSQMRAPHFSDLAEQSDGFVLQIHHIAERGGRLCIFETARALTAVRDADRHGTPFRVALPTYGHVAVGEKQGTGQWTFYSEDFSPTGLKPGASVRVVRSDPLEVQGLMGEIRKHPPENFEGFIWYRLPVGDERFNWSYETLLAVADGAPLGANLRCEETVGSAGVLEVFLVNDGNIDAYAPFACALERGDVTACDTVNGFSWGRQNGRIVFSGGNAFCKLPPGGRLKIAWLRLKP